MEATRVETEIVRLCHSGLDSRMLRVETMKRLRKAVPFDSFWFATADPATLLFTSSVVEDIPESATPAFVHNEFLQPDVNKWTSLARSSQPTSGLFLATRGEPGRSPRYRDILSPLGFGDELRAALIADGLCWGFMCLHRDRSSPGFTADEAGFLARLVLHLAEGIRTALLITEVGTVPACDGPGMLVLADDLAVVASTPAAERWLAELADWPQRTEMPQVIYGVTARLQALEDGARGDLLPRARARTAAGQWLELHAARLRGAAEPDRIAVILEPARPVEITPLVLRAYDLTDREAQIVGFALRGLSTDEIAAELSISALTVQQHLKSVFDKTGVHSRRDLVARIFTQHYLPRIRSNANPGSTGGFEKLAAVIA